MNETGNKIRQAIFQAVVSVYQIEPKDNEIMVEIPRDSKMGDYSTNIAMRLAKALKKNPFEIADNLVKEIAKNCPEAKEVTAVKPGFINFRMKGEALASNISVILKLKENYGKNDSGNHEKILYEYISANPTGDLHCGHARHAAWGDATTRLLNASGYDCLREYYINDAGHQMEMLGESLVARYFEYFGRNDVALPEDGYHAQDVKTIAEDIAKEEGDKWLNADPKERLEYFRKQGQVRELKKIQNDLEFFRVEMDSWIHETMFYEEDSKRIKQVIATMKEKGLTFEEDGALWFRSTKFGDDKDRVLIKKDGLLTYLTPDIANHVYKLERGYTKLVDLWGSDHHSYVTRMKAALHALGYPKDCLEVDLVQMVRLVEDGVEVKMSKRTGNAITLRELAEDVGVDAARWFFVSRDVGSHMDFDLKLARERSENNPVYYVQYAYARMNSIVRQCPEYKETQDFSGLQNPKEIELMKHVNEFPSIVADAAKTRMPNKICNYLHTLAREFHTFYASCRVNDPEQPELSNQRLGLVLATMTTMKNALELIGVSAPEKM